MKHVIQHEFDDEPTYVVPQGGDEPLVTIQTGDPQKDRAVAQAAVAVLDEKVSIQNLPGHVVAGIARFEEAVRADAWKGAQGLEEADAIEKHFELARTRLEAMIYKAIVKGAVPKRRQAGR